MFKKLKFLTSFSLRDLLYNKKFTVTLSILLAFIFWLLIMTKENPIIERSFADMTVNVNLENTFASENGMSIIDDISAQKFTVVVRGPTYLVSSLKSEDFNVYASAASVDAPGEYKLDVAATKVSANSGYEILKVSPSTVKISFDYIDTKEFTIKALAEGVTAKEGLIAESGILSGTESDTLTVTGPRTVINKIDSVVAYTKVNKTLSVSETFDADIVLYNNKGRKISKDNLTLSLDKVKVTVPISKKKTVPVVVDFANLPDGFEKDIFKYTLDHETVTVIGTPDAVKDTKSVTLSAIDVTQISKSSNSFEVSPKLPDGVRLLDNVEYFTVKIDTNNFAERVFNVNSVTSTNLGKGLSSRANTVKNVRICGPRNIINGLSANSIYAVVDLKNKKAGEHSVDAVIKFKNKKNIWAVGAYSTTVTIK